MKKLIVMMFISLIVLTGCFKGQSAQTLKDKESVARQQEQYGIGQPIPVFNWSLERHLVKELYKLRNQKVSTHTVWRSDRGMIEGDCPSLGFSVPYDTSLTNPLQGVRISGNGGVTSIEQAEPNGIFASKNTAATWVMCLGNAGALEPIYIETKVTTYPYPVKVDYVSNRVTKAGKTTATISSGK